MDGTARSVPLEKIRTTDLNPRKHFDEERLQELTESIRKLGILSPVLLRPLPLAGRRPTGNGGEGVDLGVYELVAGERRFRAARAAELAEIPAVVRDLTDEQAAEARIVENLHRDDLTALEEAEGYRDLHRKHGMAAEVIAEKIGKSRAYVYSRMQLADLPEPALKALAGGELTPSNALLLARLPDAQVLEVLPVALGKKKSPLGPYMPPWAHSFRELEELIRENYARPMTQATWKFDDETMPGGPCVGCPKRSSTDPDLFTQLDPKRTDVCTDVACWKAKEDAAIARRIEEAEKAGSTVARGKASERYLEAYGATKRGYVNLAEPCWEARKGMTGRAPSWKQSIGGKVPPEDLIVVERDGELRELVREKRAREIAAERKKAWATKEKSAASAEEKKWQERQRRQEEKRKLTLKAANLELAAILERPAVASPATWSAEVWDALARAAFEAMWSEVQKAVAHRHGWHLNGALNGFPKEPLEPALAQQVLVEVLAERFRGGGYSNEVGAHFDAIIRAFGGDLDARVKAMQAEEQKKRAAAARKKKAATKKKSSTAAAAKPRKAAPKRTKKRTTAKKSSTRKSPTKKE